MELIYANHDRYALGQLSSFDIDFDATGTKDFVLTIDQALFKRGYWVFIPGTEIGGIVDSVTVSTSNNTVKYSGRNFRGVLNSKVLVVPDEDNYISAQGNITDVINALLAECSLDDCFVCLPSQALNDVSYIDYAFEPFCTLYDGIIAAAASINFKLIFVYNAKSNKVEITPTLAENFTDFLTYTKNSSVNLIIEDNAVITNHFLLVGYDEAGKRYQISLFVNNNSELMPYATVDNPIKDSQYILTEANKQFFGFDETVAVELTEKLTPVENYERVTSRPKDWGKSYSKYYKQKTTASGDGVNVSYEAVQSVTKYAALSSEPSDWSQNYKSYYELVDGEYQSVNSAETTPPPPQYLKVKKKPNNWKNTYSDYYYKETDGVTWSYTSIRGIDKNYYKPQIFKPTDWVDNYGSYFTVSTKTVNKQKKTIYKKVEATKKKKAPKWKKKKYYTRFTRTYAPEFSARDVYVEVETPTTETAPTFVSNKYYRQYQSAPAFIGIYRKVIDHYAPLVSKCLDGLELKPVNKQSIDLSDFQADIGDVVGGYDEKTGIELSAPITNIIYKIERGIQRSIEYTIGG